MAFYELGTPDHRNITPLTIKLRVKFQPAGGKAPGETVVAPIQGKKIKLEHLTAAELEHFKHRFRSVVVNQWSGKLYIILPTARPPIGLPTEIYRRFLSPGLVRWNPCVLCRLEVEYSDTDFDWWLIACKPAAGQDTFPSYMYTPDKMKLVKAKGQPQGALSIYDVNAVTNHPVVRETEHDHWNSAEAIAVQQVVAGHEVGHMLGLHHVNAHLPVCKENKTGDFDANDPMCYGDTIYKAQDAMGYGSEVRSRHGYPWLRVLKHITKHKKGWKLTTDPLAAGCATPETLSEKAYQAGKEWLQTTVRDWPSLSGDWLGMN
jgi:hypothetical protein